MVNLCFILTGLLPGRLQHCACRGKRESEKGIEEPQETHLRDIPEDVTVGGMRRVEVVGKNSGECWISAR